MIILEDILSQEIVQRLGWTLLHFIWQATAVALLLAILLRLLRKSAANLRYIFACLALGLTVLLPVITIKLVPVSQPLTAANLKPAPEPTVLPATEMPAPDTIVIAKPSRPENADVVPEIPFKQRVVDTLEPALPYIVSGWLIGVFGLSIWNLGGWTQLQRLKRRMVKQVDSTLLNKLKVLTKRLKVKQTVRLMESALVQIPTVVGWLRPIILLPASALTGLSAEQLEAIVAHELAHIKRFDYLVNILQTIVETLGFYHPAVWWVSHKIRAERENCCDDMAVSISGDRVSYAGALASMEEIRVGRRKIAVAAGGGNLFRRICRLLGKDSADNTSLSWVPAVTVILLIIALAIPTTLALTNKSESILTQPQAELLVEDDIQIPSTDLKETDDTQFEAEKVLSAQKLKLLGLAVAMYADDNDENMPESIQELRPYIRDRQNFDWLRSNVEYFDKGKTTQHNAHFIPIAYDSTLFEKADGTNVLFLDFSVRFADTKELENLDIKRAEIIIDARFLAVSEDFLQSINLDANLPKEAKSTLRLTLEKLKSLDFSKRNNLILNDLDVILLLNAVHADKDSKVLANPQVICQEGKAANISLVNKIPFLTGYTEPNNPYEKPEPKFDQIEKGISLSLTPNLTPNNNIYMQFEFELITVTGFEEKTYKGKYPYKQPTVQSISQATQYTAKNGQTLLFGPHKIVDRQDGQTEQRDLLVLITARTVGSSEQDKPAMPEHPSMVEQTSSTTKVITPPTVAKSRTKRPEDNEQKPSQVQAKEDFELPVIIKRMESAKKLSSLGKALLIYANDHDDKYPDSPRQLSDYFKKVEDFHWVLENVVYLASGKTLADRPDAAIAYDKKLLVKEKGTNVLFNDCHVGFEKAEDLKKLGINIIGNKFLIEARFLAVNKDFIENINHNADSPDEAKELLKLKPELLAAVDGPDKLSFIPPDRNVSLLLKAVRAHKDSKVLATQDVICREDTTAEIAVMTKEYYYIKDYTEPNKPSEKLQQKPDRVEEGVTLSLKPKLVPNHNIKIDFEIETSQFLDFEERDLKGKPPKVQRHAQSLAYTVQNGQTFLLGGHKIADRQDDRPEEKDLLVLITAHTIGPSELDKPTQEKLPAAVEQTSATTKVITPPATTQSRTVKPDDSELKKTEPATVFTMPDKSVEPNEPMVTVNFNNVEMKFVIEKLAEWTGKIIIPTADTMSQKITTYGPKKVQKSQAVEMIYHALRLIGYTPEETDNVIVLVPIAKVKTGEVLEISEDYPLSMVQNKDQVVQKCFKLKYYSPSQMGRIIMPLVAEFGHVSADEDTGSLLIIDTAKSLMRIQKIIEQYDVPKVDETVTEIFEIRHGDPVEIVELLKKLINGRPENGAIIETGKEPIVLIPQPVYKWIIAKGSVKDINQIGQWIKKLDISKSTRGLDPIDAAVHEQLEMIVDLSDLAPGMSFGEVVKKLENSVEPPLQIQPIWKDLLENAEVEQAMPAGMDPLPHIKLRKALEILLTSVSSTGLPKLTYVVDQGVILIGTVDILPSKMLQPVYKPSVLIETATEPVQSSHREREKTTPVIKPDEMQIIRQQYINNDSRVKSLSEKITEAEAELIELRQKLTPSHPQVQQKASLLRALKKALQEREKEVGESFDDIMTKEIHQTNQEAINNFLDELRKTQEHQQPLQQAQEKIAKLLDESEELMTPLEQIQKQLDELIKQRQKALKVTEPNLPSAPKVPLIDESEKPKTPLEQVQKQLDELLKQQQEALKIMEPNLPPAQKVKFINNTFVDCPLIDALQQIAEAGNVTIIPDENVKGLVSCKLKDATVETALDIVLGGTPYIWKKTPYYYLVASGAGPFEFTARLVSAKKLSDMGKALLIYANDHDDKYPVSLHHLPVYLNVEDYRWVLSNVEYLASGKKITIPPDKVIAYDKKLLEKGKGTNVLYNDLHVGFVKAQELKQLGISESEITIETQLWSVTDDFLKDVGLDANFENLSDDWKGHLAATYPAVQNGKPYGLIIDDLHVNFLLKAISAHKDAHVLSSPQILCREGRTAEISILTEEYRYITGYNEPKDSSEEPEPKRDKVDIGTHIWLTPNLTENNRNINLDLKLEHTQLKGIIEGKYKGKYPTYKPIVEVISTNITCTIPAGKSMLIGGPTINEYVTIEQSVPGLGDLPLIGAVFRSKDKTQDKKMLLILVKPVTNPK